MNLGIIRKKGNSSMEKIVDIKRIVVLCKNCKSELRFNIDAPFSYRRVTACAVCGSSYGIDPEDDTIIRMQELIESVKKVKGAEFSFLCEEE